MRLSAEDAGGCLSGFRRLVHRGFGVLQSPPELAFQSRGIMADDEPTRRTWLWPTTLAILGGLAVITAVVFEAVSLRYHQVAQATVKGQVTTTVTGPGAPPVGLITAILGLGALFILAAAFFNRITNIAVPGLGLTVAVQAKVAGKAAKAAHGDPEKTSEIYKRVAPEVADYRLRDSVGLWRIFEMKDPTQTTVKETFERRLDQLIADAADEE